jgi:hypothetical protein
LNKALLAGLAVLAALGMIVTGCGSDDDGETTETLTKAEFIKQGDAICKKASEESQSGAEEFAKENDFTLEKASKDQIEEAVVEVLVPNLNQQAEDLEALGAPEGDEEQAEEIIVALEDAADKIEDEPKLIFEGEALAEPGKLAGAYGFKVCGQQ